MKKFARSFISCLLALVMVFSLAATASAAEEPAKTVYTCLGDSNAAGCNLPTWTADLNRTRIEGSYHDLIATALDADLRPFGTGGFRTDEILYMLDAEGFEMDWSYAEICNGKVKKTDLDVYKDAYKQAVIDADVITIQVGLNDLLGEDLGWALIHTFMGAPLEFVTKGTEKLSGYGKAGEIGISALNIVGTVVNAVRFVIDVAPRIAKTIKDFRVNFDLIIKTILDLNPDAKIVALALMNSFGNTSITPNGKFMIGTLMTPIFKTLNKWMESGSAYVGQYKYCDISDLTGGKLSLTQEDFWTAYLYAVHPDLEGHKIIADRILALLAE